LRDIIFLSIPCGMNKDLISQVMREMGRKGGKKRIGDLTNEERTALAKKAAAKSAEVRSKKAAAKKATAKKRPAKKSAKP
jgi:hypothetical protein